MDNDKADLLYGAAAIASFMGLSEPTVRGMIDQKKLPAFRLGGKVCARRSTIDKFLTDLEAEAMGRQN